MIELRTASGIDVATISVERQLPRKSRIMSAVRQAAIDRLRDDALDGAADEDGLVGEQLHVHPGRQHRLEAGQHVLDRGDHVEGGGVTGLEDGDDDAAAAVQADDIHLHSRALPHVRDIAHVDGRAVDLLDGQIVEVAHGIRAGS